MYKCIFIKKGKIYQVMINFVVYKDLFFGIFIQFGICLGFLFQREYKLFLRRREGVSVGVGMGWGGDMLFYLQGCFVKWLGFSGQNKRQL